jgi:hypothetical protein
MRLSTLTITGDETLYYSAAGSSNIVYVVKDGVLLRTLPAGHVPVAGPDDTLYFPTDTGFAAHRPFGTVKWTAPYPQPSAIDANGRLYTTDGSSIIALDFSGRLLWRAPVSAAPNTIVIGEGGRVFAPSTGGITAIDTNGVVLWGSGRWRCGYRRNV